MTNPKIRTCPFCADCSVRVGVFDDEGNQHGWPGDEYEDNPWSGLQYGIVHDGECGLGYVVFGFQPTFDGIVEEWNEYMRTSAEVPSKTQLMHATTVEENGTVVSVCEIEKIDNAFNISVSTIALCENKGYANDCVRRAVMWWEQSVFHNSYDLNWWARKDNVASIRIAEKNGFVVCNENDDFPEFVKYCIPAERM